MEVIHYETLKEIQNRLSTLLSNKNIDGETLDELNSMYNMIEIKEVKNMVHDNVLGIDYGTRRLASCVSNAGGAFLIPGNYLVNLHLQASKVGNKISNISSHGPNSSHKHLDEYIEDFNTIREYIHDYLNQAAHYIIEYCQNNHITKIVAGKCGIACGITKDYNEMSFTKIDTFETKLLTQCVRTGIEYVSQDESYTSLADFLAGDEIPERAGSKVSFSGKRVKDFYHSSTGIKFNADINAALNILKKAKVNNINLLQEEYLQPCNVKLNMR